MRLSAADRRADKRDIHRMVVLHRLGATHPIPVTERRWQAKYSHRSGVRFRLVMLRLPFVPLSAYDSAMPLLEGEIGSVESFRFYEPAPWQRTARA